MIGVILSSLQFGSIFLEDLDSAIALLHPFLKPTNDTSDIEMLQPTRENFQRLEFRAGWRILRFIGVCATRPLSVPELFVSCRLRRCTS